MKTACLRRLRVWALAIAIITCFLIPAQASGAIWTVVGRLYDLRRHSRMLLLHQTAGCQMSELYLASYAKSDASSLSMLVNPHLHN